MTMWIDRIKQAETDGTFCSEDRCAIDDAADFASCAVGERYLLERGKVPRQSEMPKGLLDLGFTFYSAVLQDDIDKAHLTWMRIQEFPLD